MWKSKYTEIKVPNGERIAKCLFWEVGVSRATQKSFKRTFRKSLEFSTPRKAFDDFERRFILDADFRNQFFIDRGWQTEKDWRERREAEELAKKKAGNDVTFGALYSYWRRHSSSEWSARYAYLVDGIWNGLKSDLQNRFASEMTKSFLVELDSSLHAIRNSRATINRKIGFVLRVMRYSFQNDLIAVNPLATYEPKPDPSPKNDFWNTDEVEHFLAVTNERYPIGSPRRWIYVAYLCVVNTGVRANELWALRPQNIRRDTNTIWITEQWSELEKKFVRLKSKDNGFGRAVPMNEGLKEALLALQTLRNLGPDDLFFSIDTQDPWYRPWCKSGAQPINHANFAKRAWKTDLMRSGNRPIRFHDLRHSAATGMRRNGASREEVKSILGHSNVSTTRRYDHAADESAMNVASRFSVVPRESSKVLSYVPKHARRTVGPRAI